TRAGPRSLTCGRDARDRRPPEGGGLGVRSDADRQAEGPLEDLVRVVVRDRLEDLERPLDVVALDVLVDRGAPRFDAGVVGEAGVVHLAELVADRGLVLGREQ